MNMSIQSKMDNMKKRNEMIYKDKVVQSREELVVLELENDLKIE